MEIEEQAREQGWVPKEEWKGPEDKWTDAKTFVDKGEKITGILKSRVDRQQAEIESLKNANKEFGQLQKKIQEKLKKDNEALLAQLEAKRAAAITEGDGTEFTRLDREIKSVERDLKPTPEVSNPLGEAWLADNEWYNTNLKLQTYADGLVDRIISEGYTGKAYFSELTRRVKEAFPDDFGNPNKEKPNAVETGGDKVKKDSKAKSYDNLPDYAKESCDKFVKAGLITQEEYVKTFEWEK